jgi:hypothetical protein
MVDDLRKGRPGYWVGNEWHDGPPPSKRDRIAREEAQFLREIALRDQAIEWTTGIGPRPDDEDE